MGKGIMASYGVADNFQYSLYGGREPAAATLSGSGAAALVPSPIHSKPPRDVHIGYFMPKPQHLVAPSSPASSVAARVSEVRAVKSSSRYRADQEAVARLSL